MMNRSSRRVALALAAAGVFAAPAFAQVSLTATGNVPSAYSQNFDTLPSVGPNPVAFTQNGTILGLYASNSGTTPFNFRVSTGTETTGALYSLGIDGTNPASDRSLGGIGSNNYGSGAWAFRFVNNTAEEITSFTLSYFGETWRAANAAQQILKFDYSISATPLSALPAGESPSGYINVPALNYVDATFVVGSPIAIDGNASANRSSSAITATVPVSVAPGSELILRWWDANDSGNDDQLAIDDLTFGYTTAPVSTNVDLLWDANTGSAGAQDGGGTWTNGSNNFVTNPGGSQATYSNANSNNVTFGAGVAGSYIVNVGGSVNVDKVTFATAGYTIAGSALQIDGDIANAGIVANEDATITAPIVNTNPVLTVEVADTKTLTVSGQLSGPAITKIGLGTLDLSGNAIGNLNSALNISGGVVIITAPEQLGTGETQTSDGGVLRFNAPMTFAGDGGGVGGRDFRGGTGGLILDTNGNDVVIENDLVGSTGLIKRGAGNLTLTSGSEAGFAFGGTSQIEEGRVTLNGVNGDFTALGNGQARIVGGELVIDSVESGKPYFASGLRFYLGTGGKLLGTGANAGQAGIVAVGLDDAQNPMRIGNDQGEVTIGTVDSDDTFYIRSRVRQDAVVDYNTATQETGTTVVIDGPGRVILTTGGRFAQTSNFAGDWRVQDGILQVGPLESGGFGGRNETNVVNYTDLNNLPASVELPGSDRFGEPLNALGNKLGLLDPLTNGNTADFSRYIGNEVVVTNKISGPGRAVLALAVNNINPTRDTDLNTPGYNYDLVDENGNSTVPAYLPNPIVLSGGAIGATAFEVTIAPNDPFTHGKQSTTPLVGRVGGDLTINGNAYGSGGADSAILLYNVVENDGPRDVQVLGSGDTNWNSVLTIDPGTHTGGTFTLNRGADILGTPAVTVSNTGAGLVVLQNVAMIYAGENATYDNSVVGGLGVDLALDGSLDVTGLSGEAAAFGRLSLGAFGLLTTGAKDVIFNYENFEVSPLAVLQDAQLFGQLVSDTDFGGVSTTLVLFEAGDLGLTAFSGFEVDADTVVGKFTYTGDANLDGQVDAFDYSVVDDNFGLSGTFTTGDLNGDGIIDAFDYSSIDDTFGAGVGNPLRPAANSEVFIPEPSSLGFLALAGGLLARRRRA